MVLAVALDLLDERLVAHALAEPGLELKEVLVDSRNRLLQSIAQGTATRVRHLSDGRTITAARVTCRARLPRIALQRGCSWRLPRSARGKRLVIRVTVAYGGRTRTRTLAYAVR